MLFLLYGGGRHYGERSAGSEGRLRPLEQELIRLVPASCPVGGYPKVTADSPLALHRPLPENVVSSEGTLSQPSRLAASHGGGNAPSVALPDWYEQSKTCHLLLVH